MAAIIDAHVHLFDHGFIPPQWHDATAWRWSTRTFPSRDSTAIRSKIMGGLVDADGEILHAEMDRIGLDGVVCIALDWEIALGHQDVPVTEVHDRYRRLQSGELGGLKGRFFSVAGIDPRREGALDMLEDLLANQGYKGFKLYPPCGYYVYDDICQPFIQKCLDHDVPLVIHTSPSGYPMRSRFAHPETIDDVNVAYPDLTVVLAHAGHGGWYPEALQVAKKHPKSYLELSNWNHDIHSDAEGVVRRIIEMRDALGAHRIIFGSDHFGGRRFSGGTQFPAWIDFIKELPVSAQKYGSTFSDEEVDLILGENAIRVYKLELERS